jgi:hypothetical protein
VDRNHDLRALLPRHKRDQDRARALVARGYPAVAPVLPELVGWLKDMNWPVAAVVRPFLATIGMPLLPEVRRVLRTDDVVWKYGVLLSLVAPNAELAAALHGDLDRLAANPTPGEREEGVDVVARRILRDSSIGGRARPTPAQPPSAERSPAEPTPADIRWRSMPPRGGESAARLQFALRSGAPTAQVQPLLAHLQAALGQRPRLGTPRSAWDDRYGCFRIHVDPPDAVARPVHIAVLDELSDVAEAVMPEDASWELQWLNYPERVQRFQQERPR